ncbi:MAG TPA: UDP-N-acetylmuramate dehydrogenase [Bacteroidales bacterium]|nr:UDP-N-acetylmuramate dehydrogenase [Bacteroidales bacterium]
MYAQNFQLKKLNTFGLQCITNEFFSFSAEEELTGFIREKGLADKNILVLGGGSNILLRNAFNGIVIHPLIEGIRIEKSSGSDVEVSVGAGVIWDDFVSWAVDNGNSGIENLSLIPGKVGASPVQNIGAYGCEAKDTITRVRFVMLNNGETVEIDAKDCHFGYRDSIFKHDLKNKVVVTRVWYRLSTNHNLNVSYGDIASNVEMLGGINLRNVREAVINIRRSKLPDPAETGNAGSFFKNPVVNIEFFNGLKSRYPNIPGYPQDNEKVKLAAGWMIEQCGWKGKRIGDAGVHQRQALVLVNYGSASGDEIIKLAEDICSSVKEKFGVSIYPEVEII